MAAIAANWPICSHVGEIALRTMSAASANCRRAEQRAAEAGPDVPAPMRGARPAHESLEDSDQRVRARRTPRSRLRRFRPRARRGWRRPSAALPFSVPRRDSLRLQPAPRPHDAAEAQVARGRVDGLRHARGGPVAAAIVRRAQVRAALHDLARNLDRLARIEAVFELAASGIARGAARRFGRPRACSGTNPSSIPRRCRPCRRARSRSAETNRPEPSPRSRPPVVFCQGNSPCQVLACALAVRRELVAPDELGALEAAACGELPLRFGRQLFAGPVRVRVGVLERDVHDGMISTSPATSCAARADGASRRPRRTSTSCRRCADPRALPVSRRRRTTARATRASRPDRARDPRGARRA